MTRSDPDADPMPTIRFLPNSTSSIETELLSFPDPTRHEARPADPSVSCAWAWLSLIAAVWWLAAPGSALHAHVKEPS